LALDEPKDNDEVYDLQGLKYLVDQELMDKMANISIDFIERGWQSGFSITAENFTPKSCGSSCSC